MIIKTLTRSPNVMTTSVSSSQPERTLTIKLLPGLSPDTYQCFPRTHCEFKVIGERGGFDKGQGLRVEVLCARYRC